ncbi:MAG: Hpt domain-containing protein [Syntrophorhabdaceae bacterium]|nr:Hpt domain-containing protein [Syntrophorhabdaceae bacterium]
MQGDEEKRIVLTIDKDLEDLIPIYLENRRKDIKTILSSLEKDDFETIRTLGHSMKGSGGGYGFDEISNIGKEIEMEAKKSNGEEIKRLLERLSWYLEHIEIVYE